MHAAAPRADVDVWHIYKMCAAAVTVAVRVRIGVIERRDGFGITFSANEAGKSFDPFLEAGRG